MGLRVKLVSLGLGLVAAGLGALGAGSANLPAAGLGVMGVGSASRPAAAADAIYEVSSLLMSDNGGRVYACKSILQSYPPQCGGGVLVNGADIQRIRGLIRYPNGTLESPVVRLTGRWAGRALTLVEPPQPATSETSLPAPCIQQPGTSATGGTPARQLQVLHDSAALEALDISVMETLTCGDTLGIRIVKADSAAIRYLQVHYGKVSVTGWLRPVTTAK